MLEPFGFFIYTRSSPGGVCSGFPFPSPSLPLATPRCKGKQLAKSAGIELLQWCLESDSGYAAIGTKHYRTKAWKDAYFPYPSDIAAIEDFVEKKGRSHDVYFCPLVYRKARRIKENATLASVAWADLDECPPDRMLVPPTVVVETSPQRYQAYWKFTQPESAVVVEEINHRIAKYHETDGCDQGGWDLVQYLRIPGTNNYKYPTRGSTIVRIADNDWSREYSLEDFDVYPVTHHITKVALPPQDDRTARQILDSLTGQSRLHASAIELFEQEPEGSWSEPLWRLELLLFSAGCTEEEVFTVCKEAACNKYARDNRPEEHLFEDVLRAQASRESQNKAPTVYSNAVGDDKLHIPILPLLTKDEHTLVAQRKTFIEDYVEWASDRTDAPSQYHEAGALIILSGILAGTVRIPTDVGNLKPNLWIMTLGETTLSRKTTSMFIALEMLESVDPEIVLATDGSVEGVLKSISTRPGRASIYHKDEFSGLLEAMTKKDYLAGAMEHFTQLYDSQHLRRQLAATTIDIRNPIFILYAGGIRDRVYTSLAMEHIASGFIPRFIFISPTVELTSLKPLGPPRDMNLIRMAELVERLHTINQHYNSHNDSNSTNNGHVTFEKFWNAEPTPEAFKLYNRIEHTMHKMAFDSDVKHMMLPTMDRLAKSGLKIAALIAASDRLTDKIVIHEIDMLHAFHYIESYLGYSIEAVSNAGKSSQEMMLELIYSYIAENPGVQRALLMRKYRLNAKTADIIFDTLSQRALIFGTKLNTGIAYYPLTPISEPEESEVVDFGQQRA